MRAALTSPPVTRNEGDTTMNDRAHARASFTRMEDSTKEDWQLIVPEAMKMARSLPDRILDHLRLLDGDFGGFPVDRLTHSRQTATLALRDGRDEEYVVCALLHDIGDTLGSFNHPDIAAAILKPFVSDENLWMVQHHGVFQGYNFFHHIGLDRNMRDQFKDHPHYRAFDPRAGSRAAGHLRADDAAAHGRAAQQHLQGRHATGDPGALNEHPRRGALRALTGRSQPPSPPPAPAPTAAHSPRPCC
jgi:predicted HD phosphohydrolase